MKISVLFICAIFCVAITSATTLEEMNVSLKIVSQPLRFILGPSDPFYHSMKYLSLNKGIRIFFFINSQWWMLRHFFVEK